MQLTRSIIVGLACALSGVVVLSANAEVLTFRGLKEQGIVSGFGDTRGQPLDPLGKIPSIDRPSYVAAKLADLPPDTL